MPSSRATSVLAPQQQPEPPAKTGDAAERPIPKLYYLDYLSTMAEVPYAAQGYASYYCLSILDKHHHPDMELEAGLKLLRMCADELRRRLPIDYKGLQVHVVDAEHGVRDVTAEGWGGDDGGVKPA